MAQGEHSLGLGEEREAVVVPQDLQPVAWNKGLALAELVGGGCSSDNSCFSPVLQEAYS